MRYVLLLKGINVGGKHRVPMAGLKEQLSGIGLRDVETYLNSGNALFDTDQSLSSLDEKITALLADSYPFDIPHVLVSGDALLAEADHLPPWWSEPMARRDVLFYTDVPERGALAENIAALKTDDEAVMCGEIAMFWGQRKEKEFLKSSLNGAYVKERWFRSVTIRNANTFGALCAKLRKH